MVNFIIMNSFPICEIINNIKNISDISIITYIDFICEKGTITLSGEVVDKKQLLKIYKDMTGTCFKSLKKELTIFQKFTAPKTITSLESNKFLNDDHDANLYHILQIMASLSYCMNMDYDRYQEFVQKHMKKFSEKEKLDFTKSLSVEGTQKFAVKCAWEMLNSMTMNDLSNDLNINEVIQTAKSPAKLVTKPKAKLETKPKAKLATKPKAKPPAVNVFELRITRINGKDMYLISFPCVFEEDWELFADKDIDCHEIVNNTMPILPDNAKFGDIVEWTDKTGYRMTGGVYQIGECNGQLVLKDIEYGYDDYGCIASFVNAANFPDSWEKINLINAYPHCAEHSVAVHIESLDLNSMHIHHSGEIRIPIVSTLSTLGPKFLHLYEEKDIDKTKRTIIDMKLENKCIYALVNQYVTEEDGTKTKIFRCDLDLDCVGIEIDTSNTALHWGIDSDYGSDSGSDSGSGVKYELVEVNLEPRRKPTKSANTLQI